MIFYASIQRLAAVVDYGVKIVLRIHSESFDKVVIFQPWIDNEDAFTFLFQLQECQQSPSTSVAE
jgi:hypothetical protein